MKYGVYYLSLVVGFISLTIVSEEFKKPGITPLAVGTILVTIVIFAVTTLWLLKKIRAAKRGETVTSLMLLLLVLVALTANVVAVEGVCETLIGDEIEYSFVVIDADGDQVKAIVDWGDGMYSITDFVPSGTRVSVSHSWEQPGIYAVMVKSADDSGMVAEQELAQVTVLAPTEYLMVELKDMDNNTLSGTVEMWNEEVHIIAAVSPENPFRYQLQPGSYKIFVQSPGYEWTWVNFSANSTLNVPLNFTVHLFKIVAIPEETPTQKTSGFSILAGVMALLVSGVLKKGVEQARNAYHVPYL